MHGVNNMRFRNGGLLFVTAALLVLMSVSGYGAPKTQKNGGTAAPGPNDKCPVCGMFVSRYPAWIASIGLESGRTLFFDGPKDLFACLSDLKRHLPGVAPGMITLVTVRDYYSLAAIDGRTAWYVLGSDVYGPMGHELIPFAKESDARGFMRDHGGKRLVRFRDVTPSLLATLR